MGFLSGLFGGGRKTSPLEQAGALMLNWSADQTKNVWEQYGEPEMERWKAERSRLEGIPAGFRNTLSTPTTGTRARTHGPVLYNPNHLQTSQAQTTRATQQVPTAGAAQSSGGNQAGSVNRSATPSRGVVQASADNRVTQGEQATPTPWGDRWRFSIDGANSTTVVDSPSQLRQKVYDSEWWAKNGEAAKSWIRTKPELAEWMRTNDPDMARKFGVAPEQEYPAAMEFNPEAWGFGQTVEGPDYYQSMLDWGSKAGGQTGDPYAALQNRVDQMVLAPDASTVGQQYADTVTTAKLLDQDKRLRSAASATGAGLAARGLNNSTMAGSSNAALANMAAGERARINADTIGQRMQLEQALRGELNNTLAQQTALSKGIVDAGNTDWYNRQNLQQNWDAQYNEYADRQAAWDQASLNARKADASQMVNFLYGDLPFALDPYRAAQTGGQIGGALGQLGSQQANRWAQSNAAALGMWGDLLGIGLGKVK